MQTIRVIPWEKLMSLEELGQPEAPNLAEMEVEEAVIDRRQRFSARAEIKARDRLHSLCELLGFAIDSNWVRKGPIRICRPDSRFFVDSKYKYIACDRSMPINDRAAQKLLTLTSESLLERVPTLSQEDRELILTTIYPPHLEHRRQMKMKLGALHTHQIRSDITAKGIACEVQRLRDAGKRVTKAAVARALGMSREHLSRRYGDSSLFIK